MNDDIQLNKNPESSCDVLIVGAGQAGGRVAQHLRDAGYAGSIVLVGDETALPYERPPLSKEFLAQECEAASLHLHPAEYWQQQGIGLHLGGRVTAVDRQAKQVELADGRRIRYGKLVVATGGAARQLRLQGDGLGQVLSLRTLEDAERLRARLGQIKRLAIVGGGVIGLEVASTARKQGIEVQVFEAGAYPMGRVLCPTSAQWLAGLHAREGVGLNLGVQMEAIEQLPSGVRLRARSADGKPMEYQADLAVAAIGVDVSQPFLSEAGLGDADGMRVDAFCRSLVDADCYAAGDVACTDNAYLERAQRLETWRNAENQAQAVAGFIMGRTEPYEELPWMWTDQHGHNIQVVGVPTDLSETVSRGMLGEGAGTLFWMRDGILRGGVLVNNGRERRWLEQLVKSGRPLSKEALADINVPLKSLL